MEENEGVNLAENRTDLARDEMREKAWSGEGCVVRAP